MDGQLWAAVGVVCGTLVVAVTALFKAFTNAQDRREKNMEDREKSLEARSKEDRDRCAAAYDAIALRLRQIEDSRHADATSLHLETVKCLERSVSSNEELVKASGRIANLVVRFCEQNGISMTKHEPAARNDESSQHFAMPDPVEKFTTARPGKAV